MKHEVEAAGEPEGARGGKGEPDGEGEPGGARNERGWGARKEVVRGR